MCRDVSGMSTICCVFSEPGSASEDVRRAGLTVMWLVVNTVYVCLLVCLPGLMAYDPYPSILKYNMITFICLYMYIVYYIHMIKYDCTCHRSYLIPVCPSLYYCISRLCHIK